MRNDAADAVFGVERSLLGTLPITFGELRSRNLLRFKREDIVGLSIETPDSAFDMALRNGSWRFPDDPQARADGDLIERVLGGLLEIEADDSEGVRAGEIREESRYRIVLTERDGSEHRLWLSPAGAGDGVLSGESTFRETPFHLDREILAAVPLSRESFEDRRLFSFDPRSVQTLEIGTGSELIRIEKRGSDWLLTEPRRIAAEKPAVWRLIFSLENLEFLRRAEPSAEARPAPAESASLSLRDADGEEIAGLRLYLDRQTGELFGRIMQREGLFVLDPAFADGLPDGVEDLEYSR